jgi:hypothetical protein
MRLWKRSHEPAWDRIHRDLEEKEEGLTEQEWEERTLCADETCIGIVGEDGICGVCGRDSQGAALGDDAVDGDSSEEESAASASPGLADEEAIEDEVEIDSSDRILCSDEACIGLVGPDGYCKICDLRWKPSGYADGETRVYRGDD